MSGECKCESRGRLRATTSGLICEKCDKPLVRVNKLTPRHPCGSCMGADCDHCPTEVQQRLDELDKKINFIMEYTPSTEFELPKDTIRFTRQLTLKELYERKEKLETASPPTGKNQNA